MEQPNREQEQNLDSQTKEDKHVRTRLDITALPTDRYGMLHGIREPLLKAYNEKRDNEDAMEMQRKLLLMILFKITGKQYAPIPDKPVAAPKPKRVRNKADTGK